VERGKASGGYIPIDAQSTDKRIKIGMECAGRGPVRFLAGPEVWEVDSNGKRMERQLSKEKDV